MGDAFLAPSVLWASSFAAQDSEPPQVPAPVPVGWEFSGNVFYSDPPGSEDRVTGILYADRGPLHLETRYNYEDLQTLSFFTGWTFEVEGTVEAAFVPMLGVVGGDTDGIAPGLEFDIGWRRLAWYAENEYLFDLDDRDDDFFYSWSTLTCGLTDWLDAGVVTERSKLVDTDWSLQRGLALEVHYASVGFAIYAYNIGSDDSYTTISLELAP